MVPDDNRRCAVFHILSCSKSSHESMSNHFPSAPCHVNQFARDKPNDTPERHSMYPAEWIPRTVSQTRWLFITSDVNRSQVPAFKHLNNRAGPTRMEYSLMRPRCNQRRKPKSGGQSKENHRTDTPSTWWGCIRSDSKRLVNRSPAKGASVKTAETKRGTREEQTSQQMRNFKHPREMHRML